MVKNITAVRRTRRIHKGITVILCDLEEHQILGMEESFRGARYMRNRDTHICYDYLKRGESVPSAYTMSSMIKPFRKSIKEEPLFKFLINTPGKSLQKESDNTYNAFDRFFNNSLDSKAPTYKKKFKDRDSFGYPYQYRKDKNGIEKPMYHNISSVKGQIKLIKLGFVKFRHKEFNRLLANNLIRIKNITVSKQNGKYYLSIQYEIDIPDYYTVATAPVGADRGITNQYVDSKGLMIKPHKNLLKSEKQLEFYLSRLDRMKFKSKNWHKMYHMIQTLRQHINNIRKDKVFKIANEVTTDKGSVIVLEDLDLKKMTKNTKGTIDNPNPNKSKESKRNKHMLGMNHGKLGTTITYKNDWNNGFTLKVNPYMTSQTCNKCKKQGENNRDGETFICQNEDCNNIDNADRNASYNIRDLGIKNIIEKNPLFYRENNGKVSRDMRFIIKFIGENEKKLQKEKESI